jgi:hypothetical protein
MPRLFLITWPCLLLVCCDKQGPSESQNRVSSTTTKYSNRIFTSKEDRAEHPSKSSRELLAQADTLAPVEREKALAAIAWEAIETDQQIAHEAFAKLSPSSPEKIRLIQHYAMRLAAQDIDKATEWAEKLETETEKSAALSQIAVLLSETDPQSAANLLVAADIPGRDFDVAAVQVIQRWASQSPSDAAAWVSMFPQNPVREAGVKIIAERWLSTDASAAFAWLSGMKDTELRQETACAMEGVILQQRAITRAAWLQHANTTIQEELEQQRDNALKDMGDNLPTDATESSGVAMDRLKQ